MKGSGFSRSQQKSRKREAKMLLQTVKKMFRHFRLAFLLLLFFLIFISSLHSACVSCFPAGTLILTPKGQISIERLRVGQFVVSYDHQTGKFRKNRVLALHRHHFQLYGKYEFMNGTTLLSTSEHPIFNTTLDKYVSISSLNTKDAIFTLHKVERTLQFLPSHLFQRSKIFGIGTVYNLTVGRDHNYFANNILVHNKSEPPSPNTLSIYSWFKGGNDITTQGEDLIYNMDFRMFGPNTGVIKSIDIESKTPEKFSFREHTNFPQIVSPNTILIFQVICSAKTIGTYKAKVKILTENVDISKSSLLEIDIVYIVNP
ncbi:MAG: hypothetical protein EP343_19490 [Deltaproteobacteria bacterium]|nr:MAG: hypothetical protein EP343_19490 [Deltaproteobacteria bacterium]